MYFRYATFISFRDPASKAGQREASVKCPMVPFDNDDNNGGSADTIGLRSKSRGTCVRINVKIN